MTLLPVQAHIGWLGESMVAAVVISLGILAVIVAVVAVTPR
jgi:hypothetical protein